MRTIIMRLGRLITTALQDPHFPVNSQKVRRILFFAAMLFCSAAHAGAQEVTLEQALDLFYKNNYDILINRYEIDKAYGDLAAAKIIPNPNVSVNYTGYTRAMRERTIPSRSTGSMSSSRSGASGVTG